MERVTLLFKFIQCPGLDVVSALEQRGFSFRLIPPLETINQSLTQFCDKYHLPKLDLSPKVTEYHELENTESEKLNIWQVKERYWIYDFGAIFWEISFNCSLESLVVDSNDLLQIEGYSPMSSAIYRKKQLCIDEPQDKFCIDCRNTLTYEDLELIFTDAPSFRDELEDRNEQHYPVSTFILDDLSWYILKHRQLVLGNLQSQSQYTSIRDSIIFATSLVKMIRYSGNELLSRYTELLPPYRQVTDSTSTHIVDFIGAFLQRFFFTHPDFILNKSDIRLHIPSLVIKSLTHILDYYGKDELWDSHHSQNFLKIPPSVMVTSRLYARIRLVPHPVLHEWAALLNPMNYSLPPDDPHYFKKLDDEDHLICLTLALELVKSVKTNDVRPLQQQTELEPFSASAITEMIGYSRGRKKQYVESKLTKLVDLNILVRASPDDLGVSRGRAKQLYYLNPQLPFTQYWIELAQLDVEDIESLFDTLN